MSFSRADLWHFHETSLKGFAEFFSYIIGNMIFLKRTTIQKGHFAVVSFKLQKMIQQLTWQLESDGSLREVE
jgi:hypothetical protein